MTSVSSDKEIRARQHRLAWQKFETALADIEKALESFSNYKGYENPSSKQDGLYELFDTGEKFKGDELEDKIQLHIDSLFSLPTKHQLHEKIRPSNCHSHPKKLFLQRHCCWIEAITTTLFSHQKTDTLLSFRKRNSNFTGRI